MIRLELTAEEQSILIELLEVGIEDLRSEIIDTDNRFYKDMLKQRRQILVKMRNSLQQTSKQAETA